MKTSLISIGNTKGIKLYKELLERCHIDNEVDIEVQNNSIIIKPIKKKPRAGWETAFKKMHLEGEDKLVIPDTIDLEMRNWEW